MLVWILADDRAGNVNQLLGIAEALGRSFERKNIAYTKAVKLPNFLRDGTLIGLTKEAKKAVQTTVYPDVVLSAGRRAFPVARYLQKKSKGKTKVVQLMNPGIRGFKSADLIVLPAHDLYKGKAENVMIVDGSPHRVTEKRLREERQKWLPVFADYPAPRLSLIIGGATKNKPFTVADAEKIVAAVQQLHPASVLITTSRRTPADVVAFLKTAFPPKTTFFYAFGDQGENPYFGLLSCADLIVVTGDSMSMCSECCAGKVPVFIFAPAEMMSVKHRRFHQTLFRNGYALPLGSALKPVKGGFNPSLAIAERILSLLKVSDAKK